MPIIARRTLGPIKSQMGGDTNPPKDPSFISVTQTNNVTDLGSDEDSTSNYFLFKTNIASGATSTTFSTDSESSDVTFTAANGRFTTTTAGDYRIGVTLSLLVSATAEFTVKIFVDSSAVYSQVVNVNSSVDPVPVTVNLIESLTADQYVRVQITRSSDENIFPRLGSTFTMNRLGPSSGGGGSGGEVTIRNNVDGYILKATGENNIIEGMPQFVSSSTGITSSVDFYISGSSSPSAGPNLFIQGSDADGNLSKMKVVVENGFLKIVDDNIE
jgi:hypothetical protein